MNKCKICEREFNITLPDELCIDCRRTLEKQELVINNKVK